MDSKFVNKPEKITLSTSKEYKPMDKKIIITCIVAFIIAIIPCYAQKKKMKGVSHGKEKAYQGDEKPGKLKELRFTVLENDEETTEIEMKQIHNFVEIKYLRDGERNYKSISPLELEKLEFMLEHIYPHEDYYQDYTSKKGQKGLEWHLGTKHESAVFLLNAERVSPDNFGIVHAVTGFFDEIFEYTTVDKPFPTGKLKSFYYSNKGSMRPGGPEWNVKATADGGYEVSFTDDSGKFMGKEPIVKKKIFGAEVGEKITEFLKAGKAQNYKEEYIDPGVTDGSNWRFSALFDSGKSLSSHGYMDGPRDMSGITNTLRYLEGLLDAK